MPDRARVEEFAALVEAGEFVAAIERFYAADASMQENGDAPRQGRDLLVAGERRVLAAFQHARAERLAPFLVDGDRVAIQWRFTFTPAQGPARVMEEVAWQRWQGDRIAEERFFYDPRQMSG